MKSKFYLYDGLVGTLAMLLPNANCANTKVEGL